MEHLTAQLRVHSLHGDIDRGQVEADDPLDILILHICQGDVVSLKERKSGVVVLKVERLTHSRRHLVDKAEDALIGAGLIVTHKSVFKGKSQILTAALDLKFPLFSVCLPHDHHETLGIRHIVVVKDIFQLFPVYGKQHISRFQFQLFRDGSGGNCHNFMSLIFHFVYPSCMVLNLIIPIFLRFVKERYSFFLRIFMGNY